MHICSNNVNFNSRIKIITPANFNKQVSNLNGTIQEVYYPWTIETLKCGKNLFTTQLMDCIAIFLTNGKNSLLAHLGIRNKTQAQRDNVKEFDINNIEEKLLTQFDFEDSNLHGIIFGGMQYNDDPTSGNTPQLSQIKNLLKKHKTPFSIIGARKNVHYFGEYSLLFNQNKDTLFITNTLFDSNGVSGNCNHKEMELNLESKVDYNVYKKMFNKEGLIYYKKRRIRTSFEEYFKSQFYQVHLNKIDTFG